MIHLFRVLCLSCLLITCKLLKTDVFQNVSIILKFDNNESTVFITSDNNLKPYVHPSFDEIKIENQKIPNLEKNAITDLINIIRLHLTHCGLRKISPGAFKNLPKLQELNLGNNYLREIENGIFDGLNFDTLYLENNQIERIENNAFNNLRMEFLFIDNNRLSLWKSGWFEGTPLSSISIRNNSLKELPRRAFEYLWKNPTLYYFLADDNNIKSINADSFEKIEEIAHLSLQNNEIDYLEPTLFRSVRRIHSLELASNKITKLDDDLFKNTLLNEVNLRNNYLNCISMEFLEISTLYIEGNPITCHCVQLWEDWMEENNETTVEDIISLKENCFNKSDANKYGFKILIVMLSLCVYIIFLNKNV